MTNVFKEFYSRHDLLTFNNIQELLKSVKYQLDDSLNFDGYGIQVSYSGEIVVTYFNKRSREYADKALLSLIQTTKYNDVVEVPICKIIDYPSFKIRGIIEGFYGEPYTLEKRKDLISFLEQNKMNSYFYAPKDDMYHRNKWREDYPSKEFEKIKELVLLCEQKNIDFWFCVSPGNDFCFSNKEDYLLLYKKYDDIKKLGVNNFCILMDDIKLELKEEDKDFITPAKAHAHLANNLKAYLKQSNLIFCPTDYMQNFDTEYRKDIRDNLDTNISVFWTGYNTVAEVITKQESIDVKEIFRHDLILWDNYPVNDFEPKRRIYLDALKNRSRFLPNFHSGMLANPMPQWELSKIALFTMAKYMWDTDSYQPEIALRESIKTLIDKDFINEFTTFLNCHRASIMDVSSDNDFKKAFKNSDFKYLDDYYNNLEKAIIHLNNYPRKKLLNEMLPYLDYSTQEIKIYRQIENKNITEEDVILLQDFKVRSSNQFILEYLNDNNLTKTKFKIDDSRRIWWKN